MKKLLIALVLINVGYYFLFNDRGDRGTEANEMARGKKNTPLLVRSNEIGAAPASASIVPLDLGAGSFKISQKIPANPSLSESRDDNDPVSESVTSKEGATAIKTAGDGKDELMAAVNGGSKSVKAPVVNDKSGGDKVASIEKPEDTDKLSALEGAGVAACYSLGPFKDAKVSGKVTKKLTGQGARVKSRTVKKKITGAWWVYLSPYESKEQALEASQVLAANDIKDYFIINNDEAMKNGISLGLYTKKDGSQRRKGMIEGLGFEPKIQQREREVETIWLEVNETKPVKKSVWNITEASASLVKKKRTCKSAS